MMHIPANLYKVILTVAVITCGAFNLKAQTNADWNINGNSISNGNFLGTTNNEPLVMKTNSTEALRIKPNGEIKIAAFENLGKGIVTFNNNGVLTTRVFPNDTNQVFCGSGSFKSVSALSGWTRTGNVLYNATGVKVGIGTSNPQYALDVVGSAYFTGTISAQGVILTNKLLADTMKAGSMFSLNNNLHMSAGGLNEIYTSTGDLRFQSNAGNTRNTIFSAGSNSGNVGIGTFNPQTKLDVNGSMRINGTITAPQFSGQGYGFVGIDPNGNFFFYSDPILNPGDPNFCSPSPYNWNLHGNANTDSDSDFIGTCDGSDLVFRTFNLERMRLTGDGNLGIGTSSPNALLQVNVDQTTSQGSVAASFVSEGTASTGSLFLVPNTLPGSYNPLVQQGDYAIFWGDGLTPEGRNQNAALVIAPWTGNSGTGLRILSNGNVGVGTSSPNYMLDVNGTINASQILINGNQIPQTLWTVQGGDMFFDLGSATGGSVGIGVAGPNSFYGCPTAICPDGKYRLAVNGGIRAKSLKIEPLWADYVFDSTYKLMPLDSLSNYIRVNGHLPGVPPAEDVASNGIDVGETQAMLLAKIEELTLYIIELNKQNAALKADIEELKHN